MVLCSAILPKKCFVIVFGMSKYVPLASKIKLCIIMLIAVTSRHFEGGFWWCTKKNEFPKKIFFKGSNNWYHCGWYFAAIEYIDPVYSLRNTLHIRRVNPNIIESPKKSWFECLLLLVFILLSIYIHTTNWSSQDLAPPILLRNRKYLV